MSNLIDRNSTHRVLYGASLAICKFAGQNPQYDYQNNCPISRLKLYWTIVWLRANLLLKPARPTITWFQRDRGIYLNEMTTLPKIILCPNVFDDGRIIQQIQNPLGIFGFLFSVFWLVFASQAIAIRIYSLNWSIWLRVSLWPTSKLRAISNDR